MALFSWFTRGKADDPARASSERPKRVRSYGAVEVIPDQQTCCEAVRLFVGKRILADEAPLFPLPDCDQPKCNCRYRRYPDRRMDIRRAGDLGFAVFSKMLHETRNRRRATAAGRRAEDQEPK